MTLFKFMTTKCSRIFRGAKAAVKISWKTTILGIITALFAFVVFDPQLFPLWLVSLAKFAAAGGLAGLGIFGKDWNVTGGTIPSVPIPKGMVPVISVAPASGSQDPQPTISMAFTKNTDR